MLQSTGKRLPEWAFQQYEVVTEREITSSSTVWTIDDVILPETTDTALWAEEEKGGWGFSMTSALSVNVYPSSPYTCSDKRKVPGSSGRDG